MYLKLGLLLRARLPQLQQQNQRVMVCYMKMLLLH
jgi:hypothetical protein